MTTEYLVSEMTTILVPLILIMDPIGGLPFFLLFTEGHTPGEQRRTAAVAAFGAFLILLLFALSGEHILRFFGVELGAFQVAGGLVFFIYALQMLQLIPVGLKSTEPEQAEGVAKEHVGLVPLATPLFAGPGAITAVLVWERQPSPGLWVSLPLLLAICAACLIVFIVLFFGRWFRRALGVSGIRLANRLMGLLLAVLAVQFVLNGLRAVL